ESANAICVIPTTANTAIKIRQCMRLPSTINPTSPYRHEDLLCVHQVGLVPLHPSSIQAAPAPGVRSSGLLFPVQLPLLARFYPRAYRRAFVSHLLQRL